MVLSAVLDALPEARVVVIDDGSTDGTAGVAAAAGATVLRHPINLGYGAALQTGYKYALEKGMPLVVQMDADGQHDPGDLPKLIGPVRAGELDLVIGSRYLAPTSYDMGRLKSMGRILFKGVARLLGLTITDPTSGFQAMNSAVLQLYARDFFPTDYPDVDVLVTAQRFGLRIGERSVEMTKGLRTSYLHRGLKPLYYVYKMLLSTWVATTSGRAAESREDLP